MIDHSGEVHHRLTLLRKGEPYIAPKTGKKKQRYYCSCSCGQYTEDNPKLITYESISNGSTKSCGCLQKELCAETITKYNNNNKRYNVYDLSGEYGIGYTIKGEEFWFDLEDYDKIKNYYWRRNNEGYYASSVNDINKNDLMLHNLITNCPENKIVDHIHGSDTLYDNRKNNLRIVTRSQNTMNSIIRKDNTSGVRGVMYDKTHDRWIARIKADGVEHFLGYYINFDDAVKVRKEDEEKYFGEYSFDNSRGKIYGQYKL